jgi:hypothetical protein
LRALLGIKQCLRIAAEQQVNDYENDGANSATNDKTSATDDPRTSSTFSLSLLPCQSICFLS